MPLNNFSSIVPGAVGVGDAADSTEAGEMKTAKMNPRSAGRRQCGTIIRLQCKACDFVQLDFGGIIKASARCGSRSPHVWYAYALIAVMLGA
jgi:hypothetical protein